MSDMRGVDRTSVPKTRECGSTPQPRSKTRKLILFGLGDLAAIGLEYFSNDSEYEVVAFTVDRVFMKDTELMGLPIVPFDEINEKYPPDTHDIHVCMVYNNLNRDRQAKIEHAKYKGYKLASYISSHAFVSPSAKIGEHAFIFENNVIQPFVEIGNNCILWSGNHVGHDSVIGDNVFVSSHVVISGHCKIGDNVFIGVNSTLANNTVIGKQSWISHGAILSGEYMPNVFVKNNESTAVPLNEAALNRALSRARR